MSNQLEQEKKFHKLCRNFLNNNGISTKDLDHYEVMDEIDKFPYDDDLSDILYDFYMVMVNYK